MAKARWRYRWRRCWMRLGCFMLRAPYANHAAIGRWVESWRSGQWRVVL